MKKILITIILTFCANSFLLSYEHSRLYYNHKEFFFDSDLSFSIPQIYSQNYKHKVLINYSYISSLIDYSQYFYDSNNILLSYSYSNRINQNLIMDFSMFIENSKQRPRDKNFIYWNDSHFGLSSDVEKGFLSYVDNLFFLKIGRDFFQPGYYSYNRILFSSKGKPFDQLVFGFKKNNISISSFYLSLSPHPIPIFSESLIDTSRHMNGHRLNFKFKDGYFAINELIIYGGVSKRIDFALLNPLLPYYIYHKNHRNFPSNSILSFEYYYRNKTIGIFAEFVLDDFQIDKEDPADLEPNEYGLLLEIDKNIGDKLLLTFSYLMISNRTFNAPTFAHEKYIHKNLPIGHFLGNNFWNINFCTYIDFNNLKLGSQFSHLVVGDEALYSEFNEDFLDYTIEQGYNEDFPFGDSRVMTGIIFDLDYNVINDFFVSSSISYWFQSVYDNLGTNYQFSLRYEFYK